MAERPIDLDAVRRILARFDHLLREHPELSGVSPERLQAFLEDLPAHLKEQDLCPDKIPADRAADQPEADTSTPPDA